MKAKLKQALALIIAMLMIALMVPVSAEDAEVWDVPEAKSLGLTFDEKNEGMTTVTAIPSTVTDYTISFMVHFNEKQEGRIRFGWSDSANTQIDKQATRGELRTLTGNNVLGGSNVNLVNKGIGNVASAYVPTSVVNANGESYGQIVDARVAELNLLGVSQQVTAGGLFKVVIEVKGNKYTSVSVIMTVDGTEHTIRYVWDVTGAPTVYPYFTVYTPLSKAAQRFTIQSIEIKGTDYTSSADFITGDGIANWKISETVERVTELIDWTGGSQIVADTPVDYTDAEATYYKDGYVLHHMDFAKATDYASTKYSFAANSAEERYVEVKDGVLRLGNSGSKAAYLMFTGNQIPKSITEYTANFKFRFMGDSNSYFGFIRGIVLKEDGGRDSSKTVEISYNGSVLDGVAADDSVWAEVTAAMQRGEWVEVSVSNVKRLVETVSITCGGKTATFNMEKNKKAEAGYMGFVIGGGTKVEIASATVLAGIAANAKTPIWPEGVTAGDLVQSVTNAAVATGTKPSYPDPVISEDNKPTNTDKKPADTTAQSNDNTTTEAPAEEKKGCGSVVAAVPLMIVATLGCAVTVCKKKKQD